MLETDLNLTAEIKLYYDLFVPENWMHPRRCCWRFTVTARTSGI